MGLFDRFKKGLARTREKIVSGFRSVLRIGRRIDQETLSRLEDTMLEADFGPATTTKLIDSVRSGWKKGEIAEEQEIQGFLAKRIVDMWPESDRQIHFAETGPTVVLVTGINGSGKTTSVAKLPMELSAAFYAEVVLEERSCGRHTPNRRRTQILWY